jgi:hypothetical protein
MSGRGPEKENSDLLILFSYLPFTSGKEWLSLTGFSELFFTDDHINLSNHPDLFHDKRIIRNISA